MNKFNIRAALSIAVSLSAITAVPSYAFTLSGTSASFDNARLSNGITAGRAATNNNFANYEQAASSNSDDNYVEFIEINGVSQVRWGDGLFSNTSRNFEGGSTFTWDNGLYVDADNNFRNGSHRDYTAQKSGLGFAGVNNVNLAVNEVFNIGTLRHYNNTIFGDGRDATKTDFSLKLDFGDIGIGQQNFDFALNIDETNNNASSHAGGVCPYETTGNGCSDKITWDFALNSENSFEYEGEKFTLELVGFNDTPNFEAGAVDRFISQEGGTSEANLFARIVKVDGDDPSEESTAVPEPGILLALGSIGLYLGKARHQTEKNVVAKV